MQKVISILFKIIRRLYLQVKNITIEIYCYIQFFIHNVKFKSFNSNGIPFVSIGISGKCSIGSGFKMNNGLEGNPIGRPQRCVFFVDNGAILSIGQNVGISSTAIVVHLSITIDDNVKIGGGTCIYDTDFHSLNPLVRIDSKSDATNKICKPVHIRNNVFIGAHSTILKGVTIGENSIIGACSVVSKNIPANEIWAGNPARFLKSC